MPSKPKILVFAGSARKDSFNKKLARLAARAAEQAGARVTFLDLRDFPMPLFDQDLEKEQGLPENARKVKRMMIDHDGFLIAAPEYNSSITPLLKNTIDWASRAEGQNESPLAAFQGKVAGLMSASPGALGGLRGLVTLRALLSNIGVLVLPQQQAVPRAAEAFDEKGALKDARQQSAIERIVAALVTTVGKLG